MNVYQVRENWGGGSGTLFTGSSSECFKVAEDLYSIMCEWEQSDSWQEVATTVCKFRGETGLGLVGRRFAWFANGDGYIWGEVSHIVETGGFIDLDETDIALVPTVVFGQSFRIGSGNREEFSEWSWAMDLSKCSGVI